VGSAGFALSKQAENPHGVRGFSACVISTAAWGLRYAFPLPGICETCYTWIQRIAAAPPSGCDDNVQHSLLLDKVAKRVRDDQGMRLLKMILKATGKKGFDSGPDRLPPPRESARSRRPGTSGRCSRSRCCLPRSPPLVLLRQSYGSEHREKCPAFTGTARQCWDQEGKY